MQMLLVESCVALAWRSEFQALRWAGLQEAMWGPWLFGAGVDVRTADVVVLETPAARGV